MNEVKDVKILLVGCETLGYSLSKPPWVVDTMALDAELNRFLHFAHTVERVFHDRRGWTIEIKGHVMRPKIIERDTGLSFEVRLKSGGETTIESDEPVILRHRGEIIYVRPFRARTVYLAPGDVMDYTWNLDIGLSRTTV